MVNLSRWSSSSIDKLVAELGTTREKLSAAADVATVRKMFANMKLGLTPLGRPRVIDAKVERIAPGDAALLRTAAMKPKREGFKFLGVVGAILGVLYLLFVRK